MTVKAVRVKAVRKVESPDYVCDVTVKDNHNLFVKDDISEKPVLAHNCLDENMKFLQGVTGYYYYSLLNISMQYGCTAYYDAEFGKDKRKTIVSADLDDALLEYCALDVVIPLHIMRLQMQRAIDIGYEKYESIVAEQVSDMIHTFSTLEHNGAYTDIDYLFYLKTKDSPIKQVIDSIKEKLKQTKGVKKANAILNKRKGVPKIGLLGRSDVDVFDISKEEHKHLLFFDVLNLKPLQSGKSGKGKIDKKFQKQYKDVEEVALYADLQAAKKLFNAYVKSFIKNWGVDKDMRFDRRIRPHFEFLGVVTGRTSAKKPSLHQIPSRSELGKHIKRIFITEEGRIMIKVDYCIAGDALIPTKKGLVRLDSIADHNAECAPVIIREEMDSVGPKTNTAIRWTYTGEKPTITLTTKSGNSITCTPDHRVGVYSGSKFKWVKAEDCGPGDLLCLSRKKVVRVSPLSLDLSVPRRKNVNNVSGYTNVYKSGPTAFYVKIKHGDDYHIERGFSTAEEAATARNAYYRKHCIPLQNRSFRDVSVPKEMTPDLAYIIGAIVADGHYTLHKKHNTVYFTNSDRSFVEKYVECVRNVFGLSPAIEVRNTACTPKTISGIETVCNNDMLTVRIRSNTITQWLSELGIHSQYGKVDGKTASSFHKVPWSILQADEESQLAFLAAYTEGDGSIKNGVSVGWDSSSKELIDGLRAILNSHGYITKYDVRDRWYRRVDGSYTTMYCLGLGRGSSQALFERMSKHMVSKYLEPAASEDRLGKLPGGASGSYHVSEIVSIVDSGVKPVYDLTMSDTERPAFVANGIIVHNCAHEVRCWSLFTGDKDVAALFNKGRQLRQRYKLAPDPDLLTRIDLEGDVHKINASYFFGVPIEEVDKQIRNAVKTVVFGLIYQQGIKGLSESTGRDVKELEDLIERFKQKYPVGVSWFEDIKQVGYEQLYVESPLGRRRHVWGLMIPDSGRNADSCRARNERQSVNSPIQGMGSDFLINGSRQIEKLKFEHYEETGHYPDFYQANSVHDSIIFSCAYEDFWLAIQMIEKGLTDAVAEVAYERHGMKFTVPLEIDFEIGANERDVKGWNYSLEQLSDILKKTLKSQKKELGHDIDAKALYADVMENQYEHMPDWAKKQCWNYGLRLKGMVKDPRRRDERFEVVTYAPVKKAP